jgi:hypothetical protein
MPLYTFFPFGIVNAIVFGLLDLVVERTVVPVTADAIDERDAIEQRETPLWAYFPFGLPMFVFLNVMDFAFSVFANLPRGGERYT